MPPIPTDKTHSRNPASEHTQSQEVSENHHRAHLHSEIIHTFLTTLHYTSQNKQHLNTQGCTHLLHTHTSRSIGHNPQLHTTKPLHTHPITTQHISTHQTSTTQWKIPGHQKHTTNPRQHQHQTNLTKHKIKPNPVSTNPRHLDIHKTHSPMHKTHTNTQHTQEPL